MIGCPTCKPSNVACVQHCPADILEMMPPKLRKQILNRRKKNRRAKNKRRAT